MRSINSHIQIPKCILKWFVDKDDKACRVWYLDLKKYQILQKSPSKLGTLKGYYSSDMEMFLSKEIETPISQLNMQIRQFCERSIDQITIPYSAPSVTKRFIKSSMARSGIALQSLLNNSITAEFCNEQSNHDALVFFSMMNQSAIDKMLENYKFNVLLNKSDHNLVTPRNCFYTVQSNKMDCIAMPISPKGAIILYPPDYPIEYENDGQLTYMEVTDSKTIDIMNVRALYYEYIYNQEFVVSSRKSELDFLISVLEKNEERLKTQRKRIIL